MPRGLASRCGMPMRLGGPSCRAQLAPQRYPHAQPCPDWAIHAADQLTQPPLQVDKGVVPLAGTDGETETQGIDDLGKRWVADGWRWAAIQPLLGARQRGLGSQTAGAVERGSLGWHMRVFYSISISGMPAALASPACLTACPKPPPPMPQLCQVLRAGCPLRQVARRAEDWQRLPQR